MLDPHPPRTKEYLYVNKLAKSSIAKLVGEAKNTPWATVLSIAWNRQICIFVNAHCSVLDSMYHNLIIASRPPLAALLHPK